MDKPTFRQAIEEALDHLHDVVALRVMSLCDLLVPDVARQQRGWALSQRLLESVEALRPDQVEGDAWPRRRYDLLVLRYVTGLTPDQVALRLSMSRRHFYRQLQRALDEYADDLWLEIEPSASGIIPHDGHAAPAEDSGDARQDLLQQEAHRQAIHRARASLPQSVERVCQLVEPLLAQRQLELTVDLTPELPMVAMSPEILRQLLLALFGEMLQDMHLARISLRSVREGDRVHLQISATRSPGAERELNREQSWQERASVELAKLQGAEILAQEQSPKATCYMLGLPLVVARTVLVVDDNEDVCALLRRYLMAAGYAPLIANTGAQALDLARRHNLYAITLDLMMFQEDGWDVLQALSHDPETADVPVIVCSVLDQQELARMMGARDFLKKPVMAQALTEALDSLAATDQSAM